MEIEGESSATKTSFKDYALLLKPLFDTKRTETVSAREINELICVLIKIQVRAKELNREQTIMAYIQSIIANNRFSYWIFNC